MAIFQAEDNNRNVWTVNTETKTKTMTDAGGRVVTMDLGVNDVHADAPLASYAAGYGEQAKGKNIADIVLPILPVDKASNKFYTWAKEDVFQDAQTLEIGVGGAVAEISPRLSIDSYVTTGYAVGSFVPTEVQSNADPALNPERQAIVRCVDVINLARERRAAALLMTAANWSGGTAVNTLAAGAKWNGGASSDPIKDIFTAMQLSATDISHIVMSERTYQAFIQNAQVQKYITYKQSVAPLGGGEAALTSVLDLPPIVVAKRKANTSTGALGYVWGDNVALIKADAGIPSGGATISTARTFRWTGAGGALDGAMQGGFLVRSYFDQKRGARGGKMVVVTHNDAEKMTSTVAGALIVGAYQ